MSVSTTKMLYFSVILQFSVGMHPELSDLLIIKSLECDPLNIEPATKAVIVDLKCGIAVLRGADVFAPGILSAPIGKLIEIIFVK